MTAKIMIKMILSNLLSCSGIHSIAERYFFSNKSFILMYHRVMASRDNQPCFVQPGMYVSSSSFEKQIVFLRDRYEIVFLEDLVEKAVRGELIADLCAITFDDGWRDNFTDAFPILEKYHVPASIFLATGFVGTDRIFWPEEICYYLDSNLADTCDFDNGPPSYLRFSKEISRFRQSTRETLFDRSISILKGYSPTDRDEVLGYFRSILKADPLPRQMLSWDEVREMLASGLVRFGAHTVNHEILDQLSIQKATDEIILSREEIELCLGNTVNTFAYPNGNNNKNIRGILADHGFNAAVTTHKGFFDCSVSLMEIPRVAIHDDVSNTVPMFRSRILFPVF